jgi:hypothetical protein
MARLVMLIRMVAMLSSATLQPAFAIGPTDPFTPPGRSHAVASQDKTQATMGALAGVRLGTRPAALIDGEWIALGQSVHGARLVGVRMQDITLQHADGRIERLALFPDTKPAREPEERLIVKQDTP